MRCMHWLIGIAIILMLCSGFYMSNLANGVQKFSIYKTHKAIGITILGFMCLRLIIRLLSKIPTLPQELSLAETKLAHYTHYALYIAMFLMPVSGYVMSSASARHIKWFFDLSVPLLIDKNTTIAQIAHTIHVYAAYVFVGLIALHVLATIKHWLFDKVNLLKRII